MRPLLTLKHTDAVPSLAQYTAEVTETASQPVSELLVRATSTLAEAKDAFTDLRRAFTEEPDGRRVGALRSEEVHAGMLRASEKTCVRARLVLHVLGDAVTRFGEAGLQGRVNVSLPPLERRDLPWWIVPEVKSS